MATYHGKHYDPDEPLCQDDFEWLTDTGPYAHTRTARIREKLNGLGVMIDNAQTYTDKALSYLRVIAPTSVCIPALEAVQEALNERMANVQMRRLILDASPHAGYDTLNMQATVQMSPERVQVCCGCRGGWCVGCVPDTDVCSEVQP